MDVASAELDFYADVLVAARLNNKLEFNLSEGPSATLDAVLDFDAVAWLGLQLNAQVWVLGQRLFSEEPEAGKEALPEDHPILRPGKVVYERSLHGNPTRLGSVGARAMMSATLSPDSASLDVANLEINPGSVLLDEDRLLETSLDSVFTDSAGGGQADSAPELDEVRESAPEVIDIVQIHGRSYFVVHRELVIFDGELHHVAIALTSLDADNDRLVLLLESSPEVLVERLAKVREDSDVKRHDQGEAEDLIIRIHLYQDRLADVEDDVERAKIELDYSKICEDVEKFFDDLGEREESSDSEDQAGAENGEGQADEKDKRGNPRHANKLNAKYSNRKFKTAKSAAVFWVKPNKPHAEAWGGNQMPTNESVEMTDDGEALRHDTKPENHEGKPLNEIERREVWRIASRNFAKSASGAVSLFDTGVHRGDKERVWYKTERPAILKNKKVGLITSRALNGEPYKHEVASPGKSDTKPAYNADNIHPDVLAALPDAEKYPEQRQRLLDQMINAMLPLSGPWRFIPQVVEKAGGEFMIEKRGRREGVRVRSQAAREGQEQERKQEQRRPLGRLRERHDIYPHDGAGCCG